MGKYFAFFRISFIHSIKNIKGLAGLSLFLIACLVIFANLWKVVEGRAESIQLTSADLLWYIAFNEWIVLSIPSVHDDIEEDLKSGRLSYLIPRPISYLGAVFAEGLGGLVANLIVLGMITFGYTYFAAESVPFEGGVFLGALVLGFAAGCLGILFNMMIGLSAFWLSDIAPFTWIWEKLLFVFGGLMLPLSIYPKWLQNISDYTPFPLILGGRSALIFDPSVAPLLCFKFLAWGLIGFVLLSILYKRGLRILCVEGG